MCSKSRAVSIDDIVYILLCAFITVAIGLGIYLSPPKAFSQEENRALAKSPSISLSSLLRGELGASLGAFYSDHIPHRSSFVSLKARIELLLGKHQNNGVIFANDGRLISKCEYSSLDTLKSSLEALRVLDGFAGVTVALIPRSVDVYTELESSARVCETVSAYIPSSSDIRKSLRSLAANGSEVFYKTDHHLSADGVFYIYSYLSGHLGYSYPNASDFDRVCVSEDFLGSTHSSSGLLVTAHDKIELFRYSGDEELTVSCEDVGCSACALYDPSRLELKDKYSVFLGGNHGLIHIKNEEVPLPRLLIIKDSFANALLPLLARTFELTVIDPRYYVGELPDTASFDGTLVLCGIDTLATTASFARIIQRLSQAQS